MSHKKEVFVEIDNPYAVPILFVVRSSTLSRISNIFLSDKLIVIDYTTRVNIAFDDALHLVAFPLVPFSDVTPRYTYVEHSLNLTLNVNAPTIVAFLSPLVATISVLAGIISALGVAKYYTRTPVADIISFPEVRFFRFTLLVIVLLVVILPINLFTLNISPRFLHDFFVPFMLLYPPYYVIGKITILNTLQWRSATVALMEAYDISITLWGLQWLINPFIVISRPSLMLAPPIILLSIIATTMVMFYLLFPVKGKVVSTTTILLMLIPFLLNTEIVARRELCTMITATMLKARLHLEDNGYVEGVIVKCSLDKIIIDNGRERRVLSWGDVRQIELIK